MNEANCFNLRETHKHFPMSLQCVGEQVLLKTTEVGNHLEQGCCVHPNTVCTPSTEVRGRLHW